MKYIKSAEYVISNPAYPQRVGRAFNILHMQNNAKYVKYAEYPTQHKYVYVAFGALSLQPHL